MIVLWVCCFMGLLVDERVFMFFLVCGECCGCDGMDYEMSFCGVGVVWWVWWVVCILFVVL